MGKVTSRLWDLRLGELAAFQVGGILHLDDMVSLEKVRNQAMRWK